MNQIDNAGFKAHILHAANPGLIPYITPKASSITESNPKVLQLTSDWPWKPTSPAGVNLGNSTLHNLI